MTILTRFQGSAAIITLNRPQRYNASNLETITQIAEFLSECRENTKIKKIIISSDHPKAFCAGGDIKAAYDAMNTKNLDDAKAFFELEYKLIYSLATYPKPIISLVNGLCFGGGMGLSMHNAIRVLTQNAMLGMPETIIGFFPDVGASFRFAQFPKAWANYYALTGNTIPIAHALRWNMADYFVDASCLPALLDALTHDAPPEKIFENFSKQAPDESVFGENWVEDVFEKGLQEIFETLKVHENSETQKTLIDLNARSPLSLRVTHKLLEVTSSLDLKKSLELDNIIALNFMKDSDFQEGIRAQIIDKDKNPKWKYGPLDINDDKVEAFFR